MTGTSPQQETVLVLESLQKSLREVPPRKKCSFTKFSAQLVITQTSLLFLFFDEIFFVAKQ